MAFAWASPQMMETSRGAERPRMRSTVSTIRGLPPESGSSCLGRRCRESGQKRVPEPPARMTGKMRGMRAIATVAYTICSNGWISSMSPWMIRPVAPHTRWPSTV